MLLRSKLQYMLYPKNLWIPLVPRVLPHHAMRREVAKVTHTVRRKGAQTSRREWLDDVSKCCEELFRSQARGEVNELAAAEIAEFVAGGLFLRPVVCVQCKRKKRPGYFQLNACGAVGHRFGYWVAKRFDHC